MAVPGRDRCQQVAAGLLNDARHDQNPDWAVARALTAIGYLLLGQQQGPLMSDPNDEASWTPDDDHP